MIQLYNTLTRRKDSFLPQNDNQVTLYTCGPTVYDYPHIGNWYAFVRWDILARLLRYNGYDVNWVMNITDVGHLVSDADEGEDKLEKGARREHKTAWEVAAFYGDYFLDSLKRLNFSDITTIPKATDHIQEQIELIAKLESKGYTYIIDDGVYFDTSQFTSYADFAKLDIEALKAGARVELNTSKRNSTDFALWKFSPKGQQRDMEWPSPWGIGFPGWHIECSAMSMKYLGQTLDIHCGGIDHIPVHHTNEIAQSEAATGLRFANYWLHTNHISVDGHKISKSLGNGITLEDIEAKGFNLQTVRLLIIESHYRSQSNFSWDALEASYNRLLRWMRVADLQWQPNSNKGANIASLASLFAECTTAMNDDMNSPLALRAIDAIMDAVEKDGLAQDGTAIFQKVIGYIQAVFGIDISHNNITSAQKELIAKRAQARANANWSLSDTLRDKLKADGIEIKDTGDGQRWYYTPK